MKYQCNREFCPGCANYIARYDQCTVLDRTMGTLRAESCAFRVDRVQIKEEINNAVRMAEESIQAAYEEAAPATSEKLDYLHNLASRNRDIHPGRK